MGMTGFDDKFFVNIVSDDENKSLKIFQKCCKKYS